MRPDLAYMVRRCSVAECPKCHRFSLDYDAERKRARCLYAHDCGYNSKIGSVLDRDKFYIQFGHGERLISGGTELDDTLTLLERIAREISDHLGGWVSVDLPSPDPFTCSALDMWDMADYLAVRWQPEDGFDYQLGIGGHEEMDKRHVSRELASKVLTEKKWLQHISPENPEAFKVKTDVRTLS
jgi:hypothetical protein